MGGEDMKNARLDGRPDLADFHRKVLMDDMMPVVGVGLLDAIDVDGAQSYVRARANCRKCSSTLVCRDWLAEHSEGEPQDFCPNASLFRAIKGRDI